MQPSELGKTDAVLHHFWKDRCRVTRGQHVHHVLVVQRSIHGSQIEGTRVVSPVICKTYMHSAFFLDHSHFDYRYPTGLMHACSPLGTYKVPHWERMKYVCGGCETFSDKPASAIEVNAIRVVVKTYRQ